jgi:hypothetical protein
VGFALRVEKTAILTVYFSFSGHQSEPSFIKVRNISFVLSGNGKKYVHQTNAKLISFFSYF